MAKGSWTNWWTTWARSHFVRGSVCFKCSWKPLWSPPLPIHQPHTVNHTHTHLTDNSCSLLQAYKGNVHRVSLFPFHDHPNACLSYTGQHTHTHHTNSQRNCKSALLGPLTHTHTHTLGVAVSRNLGGSVGWQGRSVEVAELLLWIVASVCPIMPGLRAVNTRSWSTHKHTQKRNYYVVSKSPKTTQTQWLELSGKMCSTACYFKNISIGVTPPATKTRSNHTETYSRYWVQHSLFL